jgi:hypothetical protein
MWKDTIVEEVREIRQQYAAQFNYDLDAIFQDLKKQEQGCEHEVVSFPPKKPTAKPAQPLQLDT